MKIKNNGKISLSLKERVALSCFMEAVPSLIDLWKRSETSLSFDEWLRNIHDEHKNKKKGETS